MRIKLCGLALLLSVPLMLTACQQTTRTGGAEVLCVGFQPITYADADTRETVRQIIGHNAAWGSLCGRAD